MAPIFSDRDKLQTQHAEEAHRLIYPSGYCWHCYTEQHLSHMYSLNGKKLHLVAKSILCCKTYWMKTFWVYWCLGLYLFYRERLRNMLKSVFLAAGFLGSSWCTNTCPGLLDNQCWPFSNPSLRLAVSRKSVKQNNVADYISNTNPAHHRLTDWNCRMGHWMKSNAAWRKSKIKTIW